MNIKHNTNSIKNMKINKQKISMITCYDYNMSCIIDKSSIDIILVGDSGSMILHGNKNTANTSVKMMSNMTKSVRLGTNKFIVSDMPFLSQRKGKKFAIETAESLIKSGADSVKIEGVDGHRETISYIVESGIPVMGHIGLMPQFLNNSGQYKVHGRDKIQKSNIINNAKILEELGCFSIVLECVPEDLASIITKNIDIPVIGIGAGIYVDGQVMVSHDMLGLTRMNAKFVRSFINGNKLFLNAFNEYNESVKNLKYPNKKESY